MIFWKFFTFANRKLCYGFIENHILLVSHVRAFLILTIISLLHRFGNANFDANKLFVCENFHFGLIIASYIKATKEKNISPYIFIAAPKGRGVAQATPRSYFIA